MTDDLVTRLRAGCVMLDVPGYECVMEEQTNDLCAEAANHIEDLKGQIKFIQGAAQNAQRAYEQHLAVYRKALDEKPPVWHDDIQSLQERDAVMTDRIETLEAALLIALGMLSEAGISSAEKCELAYEHLLKSRSDA